MQSMMLLLAVASGSILWHLTAGASGETITSPTSATTELKQASSLSGITINGADNSTVPVKLLVTSGTLSMTTTTGLSFTNSSGGALSNPQTGSTLYFSGTRSDVNAALNTLKYTRNATGTDTLEITLTNPGEVFFPNNGHLYEYVSSTLDWNNAKNAAAARTKDGATGYLATITSQAENDFVSARLGGAGWMGASDVTTEGTWKWVTGPENGTTFCINNVNCIVQTGQYANWNNGEPNDSGSNEDCGQFLSGGTGKWNDLPCSGTTLAGYVVEYGASGNMPSVSSATVVLTTSDTTAPTTPGTPSTTSPTTSQKPAWAWTASTDSGVGLASPAYTVQWSQDSSFTSGITASTASSASFTQPSNLADGQWYFRVKATDLSSNASSYSSNGTVVVDTTGPTQPDIGAATITTDTNTPTLSWNASTDSGAGLANPAYTVQRSQSASFSSGNTSATTNSTSFTSPALSDGIWYFRIKATDVLSHDSSWSNTINYIVDTTDPTTPGTPSTSTPTNTNTPTWTWTASTDGGSGLGSPPYTIEWSQDPAFSGLGGISGVWDNSYSVPDSLHLIDGTWYFRVLATDAAGNNSSWSAGGSVVVDTVAPVISDVEATSVSDTSQAISWTTDKIASTQVRYGPTTTYGTTTSQTDTAPRVLNHSVTLTGLVACTLYHYKVTSIDHVTNSTSSNDATFITSGCAGSATVTAHNDATIDKTSGGSISLTNSGSTLALTVPGNFASSDADFQIKKLDAATAFAGIGAPSGLKAVGIVYDLKAMKDTTHAITSFTNSVSVTMSYTADDLAQFLENSLTIYRWDDGIGWQQLTNCSINKGARTVTCDTQGFSTFALFGKVITVSATSSASKTSHSTKASQAETVADSTTQATPVTSSQNNFSDNSAGGSFAQAVTKPTASHNWGVLSAVAIAAVGFVWWFIAILKRRRRDENE